MPHQSGFAPDADRDSVIHRVTFDCKGQVIDVGTADGDPTPQQVRALIARDWHCRYPGCDAKPSHCEAHHVVWRSHHGPTNLDNLVLMCRRHHNLLHTKKWQGQLDEEGTFTVTTDTGRQWSTHPPGMLPTRLPIPA